jgi:hypothetical protein
MEKELNKEDKWLCSTKEGGDREGAEQGRQVAM